MNAYAVCRWTDGRSWDDGRAVTIDPSVGLKDSAKRIFDELKGIMAPARLLSVEVIYKGSRAKIAEGT